MPKYKYSIWEIVHESIYTVNLVKKEDTNSESRIDKMNDGVKFAASFIEKKMRLMLSMYNVFLPTNSFVTN